MGQAHWSTNCMTNNNFDSFDIFNFNNNARYSGWYVDLRFSNIKSKHTNQITCPRFVFIIVLIAFDPPQSEKIDEYIRQIFLNIVPPHQRTYSRRCSCWFCSHKYDFYCGALAAFLFILGSLAGSLAIIFVDSCCPKTKSINFQCVFADLFSLLLYLAGVLVVVIIVSLPLFVMLS